MSWTGIPCGQWLFLLGQWRFGFHFSAQKKTCVRVYCYQMNRILTWENPFTSIQSSSIMKQHQSEWEIKLKMNLLLLSTNNTMNGWTCSHWFFIRVKKTASFVSSCVFAPKIVYRIRNEGKENKSHTDLCTASTADEQTTITINGSCHTTLMRAAKVTHCCCENTGMNKKNWIHRCAWKKNWKVWSWPFHCEVLVKWSLAKSGVSVFNVGK